MSIELSKFVSTKTCLNCGEGGEVIVGLKDYEDWKNGKLAQDAFPYLSRQVREQLISGIHPACWQEMFGNPFND